MCICSMLVKDLLNSNVLIIDSCNIVTNSLIPKRIKILDCCLNKHEGLFIDNIVEGINFEKISNNNGFKNLSIFDCENRCIFSINEHLISTNMHIAKIEFIVCEDLNKKQYEGFITNGRLKLTDFVERIENNEKIL